MSVEFQLFNFICFNRCIYKFPSIVTLFLLLELQSPPFSFSLFLTFTAYTVLKYYLLILWFSLPNIHNAIIIIIRVITIEYSI